MTRDDVKTVLNYLSKLYGKQMDLSDPTGTVDAWHFALSDCDFAQFKTALMSWIRTSGSSFPPTVPEIMQAMRIPDDLSSMGESEAWALVSKALRNGAYHAAEEFDRLPETIKRAVGSSDQLHNWAIMENDGIETVIASNFIRAYRAEVKRERDINAMPAAVRQMIEAKTERLHLTVNKQAENLPETVNVQENPKRIQMSENVKNGNLKRYLRGKTNEQSNPDGQTYG